MGPIGCPRGNKVVLLTWAPVSGAGAGDGNGKDSAAAATRRRYVPVRLLELEILVFFASVWLLVCALVSSICFGGRVFRSSWLTPGHKFRHNVGGDRSPQVPLGRIWC
jgi:hypothetical protein